MSTCNLEDVKNRLIRIGIDDSAARRKEMPVGGLCKLDSTHANELAKIINALGCWPRIDLVGHNACFYAFLIAQHCDHDLALQKRCLEEMRKAVRYGKAEKQYYAMLIDRVLVNEGRLQRYGSQLESDDDGRLIPKRMETPHEVDQRREAMGMEPIESYISFCQATLI